VFPGSAAPIVHPADLANHRLIAVRGFTVRGRAGDPSRWGEAARTRGRARFPSEPVS